MRILAAIPLRLLCVTAALTACTASGTYQPRVDLAGVEPGRYEDDLCGCRRYAEQVAHGGSPVYGPLVAGVVIGASFGAGLGAAFGGLFGSNTGLATSYGAESGAVAGLAGGAVAAAKTGSAEPPLDERQALDRCLRNNGYKVLD